MALSLRGAAWPALALALWLAAATPVGAQANVTATGRVVNGTAGGTAPTGFVKVVAARNNQPIGEQNAPIGPDGRFSAADLPAGPDVSYVALAEHAGVSYWSDLTRASADLTVRVYERTDAATITVERHSIAVVRPDPNTRAFDVLELLVLRNDGDRTWVPRPDGPSGPMGLLRFSLPEGATDLRPGGLLGREEILQVDRGFATTMPVLPGRQEVSFAYRVGYGTGERVLTKTLVYPTEEAALQVPDEIAGTVVGLSDAGVVGADRRFHQYRAAGLEPRTQIVAHLRNLPGAPPDVLSGPVRWSALGLAALAAAGAAAYALRPRPIAPATADGDLARHLAELELAHERGQIDEESYRSERTRLEGELVGGPLALEATG
ncbi:MAG TPA: hypothetical protein VGM69_11105 [Chloroflexota bacterium]